MLVAGVIDDDVDDEPHAASVHLGDETVNVGERPEDRVHALIVADVVPVVRVRRRVERRHPYNVGSKRLDVIDSLDDARDVANPIAVTIAEAPRIDLIDNRRLPPRTHHFGATEAFLP